MKELNPFNNILPLPKRKPISLKFNYPVISISSTGTFNLNSVIMDNIIENLKIKNYVRFYYLEKRKIYLIEFLTQENNSLISDDVFEINYKPCKYKATRYACFCNSSFAEDIRLTLNLKTENNRFKLIPWNNDLNKKLYSLNYFIPIE